MRKSNPHNISSHDMDKMKIDVACILYILNDLKLKFSCFPRVLKSKLQPINSGAR